MKILVVCLGNICRSPLAEGLLQREITERGLDWQVDSAGTGHWHVGQHPDHRSVAVGLAHGIDIGRQRARQIIPADLDRYDLILTMDQANQQHVSALAHTSEQQDKIHPILAYANYPDLRDVPDPYWDDNGFEKVYTLLEVAARHTVDRLLERRGNRDEGRG